MLFCVDLYFGKILSQIRKSNFQNTGPLSFSSPALIPTNKMTLCTRDLQGSLESRHFESSWLKILTPPVLVKIYKFKASLLVSWYFICLLSLARYAVNISHLFFSFIYFLKYIFYFHTCLKQEVFWLEDLSTNTVESVTKSYWILRISA